MAEVESLEIWTVATFNVVIFGLIGVLSAHLTGVLSEVLSGLGTLPGVLVFGYLWTVVVVATKWALSEGGLDRFDQGELGALVTRGGLAGGLIGSLFLTGIILTVGLQQVLTGGVEFLSFGIILIAGGTISAVVGGLVGVVFVLLDVGLYRAVSLIARQSQEAESTRV